MHKFSGLLSYGLARRDHEELIDTPGLDSRELRENLHDMGRINRLLGGVTLSHWALGQFVHSAQPDPSSLSILDVGCGIGDISHSLAHAFGAQVFATDISPQIVRMAAEEYRHGTSVSYAAADGMRLPLPDASVDVAHCSFTLHHFGLETAEQLLHEMARVARRGVIVNDLVRSWPGIAGAWLLGHVISSNRLTRHDGLASARRAYTHTELCELAERAGLRVAAMRVLAGYRAVLVLN